MRIVVVFAAVMVLATAAWAPSFAKPAAGRQADAALPTGNASAGAAVVTGKGRCLSCHRIQGKGSRLGPELTDIGVNRTPAQLETSLIDPAAEILPENRFYRVVTREGTIISGRILNHDTFHVLMMDAKEQLRSFDKSDLREHGFAKESGMPSYRETLTAQERADVIAYLMTLKGVAPE